MKSLWKVLRELLLGIGMFFAALIVGQLLYMLVADTFNNSMDTSQDATNGAAMAFAGLALLIYIPLRILKRKRALAAG